MLDRGGVRCDFFASVEDVGVKDATVEDAVCHGGSLDFGAQTLKVFKHLPVAVWIILVAIRRLVTQQNATFLFNGATFTGV